MVIIGLTGSIGMGKSTAAARFRDNGIAVFDADRAVHALYESAAAGLVEAAFPGTTVNGVVDRKRLLGALMREPDGFNKLEAIVHPLVREMERRFLAEEKGRGARMAVLEIPLLFETGGDRLVDLTVVVSASGQAQRERVLARPGMSEEKLEEILARQMSDAQKRARADFVVDSGGPIPHTQAQIDRLVGALRGRVGTAYHRHWKTH